jgi:transcriptional regulator with PAS, ATPase and Fis domain
VDLAQVPPEVRAPAAAGGTAGDGYAPDLPLEEVERRHILRVLEASGGNKTRAAEVLGVTVRTLYNRLDAYRREG